MRISPPLQLHGPTQPSLASRTRTLGHGGAGLWEAGGPHSPRPRLRVGSQGGMPTRSPPEAGLAGDELESLPDSLLVSLPYPWVYSHFDASGAGKSIDIPWESRTESG